MTLRPLRGEQDAQTRAKIHRAVFGGSGDHQPTTDAYRSLMADGQYRSDLDWIVEEADGTPVAFCLSWIDEPHAVVVLEPVGTARRYRRRGLAQAAIVASLKAAAAAPAPRALRAHSRRAVDRWLLASSVGPSYGGPMKTNRGLFSTMAAGALVAAVLTVLPAGAAQAEERHRAGPWPDYDSCMVGRANLVREGFYFNISGCWQYGPGSTGYYINYSQ